MIRNLGKLFLALCFLTFGGGIAANAQIDSSVKVQANVPFTFVVGDTTLPAGNYEIRVLDEDTLSVFELRSASGHTSVLFDTESVQTKNNQILNKCELVFDKVGDKYFLSQIFASGSASGAELIKSRMEKRLEKGGMKPERHSIAANLRKR